MYKFISAFVLGGILGTACATSNGPKLSACHNAVQAAPTLATAPDLLDEHVRHMRSRRQVAEIEEAPKVSDVAAVAQSPEPVVDDTPTGSTKRDKPRKAKLHTHKKRTAASPQDVTTEQAQPAETERPPPRGLLETLFSGN
jgi:hypothetical protein